MLIQPHHEHRGHLDKQRRSRLERFLASHVVFCGDRTRTNEREIARLKQREIKWLIDNHWRSLIEANENLAEIAKIHKSFGDSRFRID